MDSQETKKLYYDLIETPIQQKLFEDDGEDRIIQDDDRLIPWFSHCPDDAIRSFDSEGYPIFVQVELNDDGEKYDHYTKDDNGLVVPDFIEINKENAINNKINAKSYKDGLIAENLASIDAMWEVDKESIAIIDSIILVGNSMLEFDQDVPDVEWRVFDAPVRVTSLNDFKQVKIDYVMRMQLIENQYTAWKETDMLTPFEYVED